MMKKKPRQKLTALQQKRLVKVSLGLLFAAIIWLIFAPNMGFVSWQKQHGRLKELENKKIMLEEENAVLRQEIERIQNDIEYFEKLAREKHGLLKKNEILFDFSKEEKRKAPKKD